MSRQQKVWATFTRDTRGAIAPISGLMMATVIGVSGAALEFGNSVSAKSEMQAALDAAILAAADVYRATGDVGEAEAYAKTFLAQTFEANGQNVGAGTASAGGSSSQIGASTQYNFKFQPPAASQGLFSATLRRDVPTALLSTVGFKTIAIEVESNVVLQANTVEVALVLDVTGSMGGQRLADMKTGAKQFIDIVMPPGVTDGSSKVAIVPFSEHVNVGREFYHGVVRSQDRYADAHVDEAGRPGDSLRTCIRERVASSHRYTDAAPAEPFIGFPQTKSVTSCTKNDDEPEVCVTQVVTNDACRPQQVVMPLTTDRQGLKQRIDNLVAAGATAGHLGTTWGWNMVSPNWTGLWPLASRPVPYATKNHAKVVVIMTDGEYNRKYEGADATTQALGSCNAMKTVVTDEAGRTKPKVDVYTIGLGIGANAATRQVLQSCATDASHAFFPDQSGQLSAAFQTIGRQIALNALGARIASKDEIAKLVRE